MIIRDRPNSVFGRNRLRKTKGRMCLKNGVIRIALAHLNPVAIRSRDLELFEGNAVFLDPVRLFDEAW